MGFNTLLTILNLAPSSQINRRSTWDSIQFKQHTVMPKNKKYKIVRFYQSGEKKVMRSGLSLCAAQAHCNDPKTQKEGVYFDGYTDEVNI